MNATDEGAKPATPRIRLDVLDQKCAERGAVDDTARATIVGVDRVTLWRWRHRRQVPSLARIADLAQRFGLTVEDLIERAP